MGTDGRTAKHATSTPFSARRAPRPEQASLSPRARRPLPKQTGRQALRYGSPHRIQGSQRNPRNNRYGTRRRPEISWSPIMLVPLALVLVLGFGVLSLISSCDRQTAEKRAAEEAASQAARIEAQRVHPEDLSITVAGISTPKSAWRQGEMPHLYQTDPAWAFKPYGGGTVHDNACGPTALTMVYVYLTGKTDYDPGTMAAFSDAHGYAPTGATEWAFMTEGAALLGLHGKSIPTSRSGIRQALDLGRPVICSMLPGDFTNIGHFIVLKSVDSRGMVEVFDPNSPANSVRRWPVQRIINQINNAWSFAA